jgi:hypothetical protein
MGECANTAHCEVNSKDICVEKSCDKQIVNSSASSGRVCGSGNCYAQEQADGSIVDEFIYLFFFFYLFVF